MHISQLKYSIKSAQDKNEEVYNNLKTANINLQMENANLLKCDKCDQPFESKETLKAHNEIVHEGELFKCDKCYHEFENGRL